MIFLATSTTSKPIKASESTIDDIPFTTTRMPTTSRTTTIKSITKPISTKPTMKPEKVCEHGQYYSYPNSCNQFLICVNGNLITQQCGPGLNWNEDKNMCDWAFKNPCTEKANKKSAFKAKDMDEKVDLY